MSRYYDNFLEALDERYPRKSDLVNSLMDILHLERENVYRRLRKDVLFTADEMMRIAGSWNISLDNIIYTNPSKIRPFRFNMIDYANPTEEDYTLLENFNKDLETVCRDPESTMFEVVNALPRALYCRSENLTRFFTMKWFYKYGAPGESAAFGDIRITERMRAVDAEYLRLIHDISETHSIHDYRFIEHIIDDILYFHSVRMLSTEDVALLKNELFAMLDYIEEVTVKGYFRNTDYRFHFYLSHIWLETEYTLFGSKTLNMSFVKILSRNNVCSSDRKVFDRFMNMVQSIKRSSELMSESNALKQIEFLTLQRKIVNTL